MALKIMRVFPGERNVLFATLSGNGTGIMALQHSVI